jgi:hypothetical protein
MVTGKPQHGRRRAVGTGLLAALACALWLGPSRAAAGPDDPAAVLARAKAALGVSEVGSSVIHYRAVTTTEQAYQSDRSYPPFFSAMANEEAWFDPATGVERTTGQTTFPGTSSPPGVVSTDGSRSFAMTKDAPRALPISQLATRYLNPWAVIVDWSTAGDVRSAGRERYRDYVRQVLVRATPEGEQRLFLDPKTGIPVKLEMMAKHYLWGQRKLEYLYSNWIRAGNIVVAGSSFGLADGQIERSRTLGHVELVTAPPVPLVLPALPARSPDELPGFLQPQDLTVVPVGPSTYLLSNAGYTEAVTRIGDQVFVFDATQGEQRARKDAAAIARLFPGLNKVTVVVTDLAWPHIAGVRFWVALGATIITHDAGRAFLRSVLERKWTLAPDLLEQRRATVHPTLIGVTAVTRLGAGQLTLHPIDGAGSEGALMAYVTADRFLWASDYLQTLAEPSVYASDVVAAARRDGLHPERSAAQHLPLTPWAQVEALVGK